MAAPPAIDWTILEFANSRLPREFTVTFEDAGTGWGEWSAVALSAIHAPLTPASFGVRSMTGKP